MEVKIRFRSKDKLEYMAVALRDKIPGLTREATADVVCSILNSHYQVLFFNPLVYRVVRVDGCYLVFPEEE